MENKEILEKMVMLKDKREQEIAKMDDFEKLNTVINDIRYLGKVEFTEELDGKSIVKEKDIYLLIEEKEGMIINKYYDEDMQLVAAEDGNLEMLLPSKDFNDKDQSYLEQIAEMDKEGKSLSEIELQVEQIEKIAEILGISPELIEELDIIDLEQEIQEKDEIEQGDKRKLTKAQTDSLDIRETTSLNENVKGETLAKKLGVDNMELPNGEKLTDGVKLARVSTNSLNRYTGNHVNMIDSFVIIRSNGEAVPVGEDILEPDTRAGKNPTSNNLTVNNDGTVDRENNTSSYRIVNGNGNEFLKVGYDENSGREIKYSQWSNEKGEYVDTELKTSRDTFINDDVRQYLKARNQGIREATETLEKAEHHEKYGEIETDVTLIDNDPSNDLHIHIDENDYIPNTNTTWREFANQCGYRGEDSLERAQEKFEQECAENTELSNEEIIENVIEEENEDYRHLQERKR